MYFILNINPAAFTTSPIIKWINAVPNEYLVLDRDMKISTI